MIKQKIFFKNSIGQKLAGVLYKPKNKKEYPIAIFCHGYKSSKWARPALALSETLPKKGIGFFAFDFSGNGESEGKFEDATVTQYIDDLKCAIDLISKKTRNITLIGASLGGLISLNAVSHDKRVKILILISPLSHFRGQIRKEFERRKKSKKDYIYTTSGKKVKMKIKFSFYLDALKYLGNKRYNKISVQTLILHGDNDKIVNIKDSIRLNKIIKESKLIIIKGADHRYSKKKDFNKVINKTTEFIVRNIR